MQELNFNLFLDDWREPVLCATYMHRRGVDCRIYHEDFIIVRSYGQFIKTILEKGLPKFVSFDYDLADVEELKETLPVDEWFDIINDRNYNGLDCAHFMIKFCTEKNLSFPKYAIHSDNVDGGRKELEKIISEYVNKNL